MFQIVLIQSASIRILGVRWNETQFPIMHPGDHPFADVPHGMDAPRPNRKRLISDKDFGLFFAKQPAKPSLGSGWVTVMFQSAHTIFLEVFFRG